MDVVSVGLVNARKNRAKCQCCLEESKVIHKDFRKRKDGYMDFKVCSRCFSLQDVNFWKTLKEKRRGECAV